MPVYGLRSFQSADPFGDTLEPDRAGSEFGLPEMGRRGRRTSARSCGMCIARIEEVGGGSAMDSFAKQGITTICERAHFVDAHTIETNKTKTRYQSETVYPVYGFAADNSAD